MAAAKSQRTGGPRSSVHRRGMPDKTPGGVFCTGHMSPSGVDMQNWCSLINKEFVGEYKLDHGLKKPNGPGRNELPDWNETRKPPVKLPITGTSTTTILGGQPRSSQRSSDAIGAFWTEPTSQHLKFSGVDRYNVPEIAARPNAGLGRTTSSQIGRFYNQEYVELYGPIDPPTTAHNKNSKGAFIKTSFALEDIPVADRIL